MALPSPPRALLPLADTRLGVLLGLALAASLGLASFMVPDPRAEGALPFSESLVVFFDPPALHFWWFYLLAVTAALWGLNLLLGTWSSLSARSLSGSLDARFWGIALMHLGAFAGLLAHLQAGATAGVEGGATLSSVPTTLGGHELVVESAELVENGDGSLRGVRARVQVDGQGRTFGFNDPLWLDGGRRFVLLQGPQELASLPGFEWEGQALLPGVDGALAGSWVLQRVSTSPSLKVPMVLLLDTESSQAQWLPLGGRTQDGLLFSSLGSEVALAVVLRRNDGLPLLAVGMLVFVVGIGLFMLAPMVRRGR